VLWTQSGLPNVHTLAAAGCFADWLGLWFARNLPGLQPDSTNGRAGGLSWRLVEECEWKNQGDASDQTAAQTAALPDPIDLGHEAVVKKLRELLGWNYPDAAATRRSAKASVTELRRAATLATDDEAEKLFTTPSFSSGTQRSRVHPATGLRKLNAAEVGAAHHKFLQHMKLANLGDLGAEADRLARENLLTPDERAALDFAALADFWESPLGQDIGDQEADWVKRELPFTARFGVGELAGMSGRTLEPIPDDEFVVVQGVADLVVLRPDEIWLVDFKTDRVRPGDLAAKSKEYEPQVRLYAAALNKIFGRPVTRRVLHFLAAGKTIEIG